MIVGTPAMTWTLPMREARRLRDRVFDQLGAGRNPRHAQPRLVQIGPPGCARAGAPPPAGSTSIGTPKALAIEFGGDVVMGRADAAGREDVGIAGAKRVDGSDDLVLDIRNDPDLADVDRRYRCR